MPRKKINKETKEIIKMLELFTKHMDKKFNWLFKQIGIKEDPIKDKVDRKSSLVRREEC